MCLKQNKYDDSFMRISVIFLDVLCIFVGILLTTGSLAIKYSDSEYSPPGYPNLDEREFTFDRGIIGDESSNNNNGTLRNNMPQLNNVIFITMVVGVATFLIGLIGLVSAFAQDRSIIMVFTALQFCIFLLEILIAMEKPIEVPRLWIIGSCLIFLNALAVLVSFCLALNANGGGQVRPRMSEIEMINHFMLM
jgi:hypothetical protein